MNNLATVPNDIFGINDAFVECNNRLRREYNARVNDCANNTREYLRGASANERIFILSINNSTVSAMYQKLLEFLSISRNLVDSIIRDFASGKHLLDGQTHERDTFVGHMELRLHEFKTIKFLF